MGMDKVFVHMAQRYYCSNGADGKSKAFWMPEDKLKTLCEKAAEQKDLVMGAVPPNLILRDSTDVKWRDFYSLKIDYTILYFWDPECGHCKKITPKLQTLYEKKFRERNIEIFAVGKAVGEDFDKWKAFIKKNNLEFINVAVTDRLFNAAMDKSDNQSKLMELLGTTNMESLNYQKTYDIYATPKMWVLNDKKEIIAKSLSVSQLEDLMDRLQGKSDLEKIFPPEEEPEDEKIH
jgi:thiol-disulfide isomerase/thioredoxin